MQVGVQNCPCKRSWGSCKSSYHRSRRFVSTSEYIVQKENNCHFLNLKFPVANFPIRRGLTDESEILKFLQHGTLVGLLPVPHPILIRKYQANNGTAAWFRTYMWGVIYLRWVQFDFCRLPESIFDTRIMFRSLPQKCWSRRLVRDRSEVIWNSTGLKMYCLF